MSEKRIRELERVACSDAYTRDELHLELDRAFDRRELELAKRREERARSRKVTVTFEVEIWQKDDGTWLVQWPWVDWPTSIQKKYIQPIFGFDPEEKR